MPLYEYQCDACGTRFERIQKFSDPPVDVCPNCGGPVRKLLSSPAIQFKGSGWYITDYAKSGSSSASAKPEKSGDAAASPKAAPETKSDTSGKTDTAPRSEPTKPTSSAD